MCSINADHNIKKPRVLVLYDNSVYKTTHSLFFEDLEWDDLKVIAGYMTMRPYDQGEVIFYEGDPGNGVCFVVEGSVNIGKEAGDVAEVQAPGGVKRYEIVAVSYR